MIGPTEADRCRSTAHCTTVATYRSAGIKRAVPMACRALEFNEEWRLRYNTTLDIDQKYKSEVTTASP
jgi:hypothetical protein